MSDFVGQINDLRDENVMKRLLIKTVEQKLIEGECFEIRLTNGIPFKRLTEKGAIFGIEAEPRISEKGTEYDVFFYSEKAQRTIVKKLKREWLGQE